MKLVAICNAAFTNTPALSAIISFLKIPHPILWIPNWIFFNE